MNFKKILTTLGVAAAMAVSASSSLMASMSGIIDVPFAFKYMRTEMPAGRYTFRYSASPSAVLLTNIDRGTTIQVHVQDGRTMQPLKLIFGEQEGTHILKEVK